jgi:hypothetical protein
MLYVLIDTCVWLDLAKDHHAKPLIAALESLIQGKEVRLLVPQIVLDEFRRNKARVIDDARRSLQSHFRLVRDAVQRFGDDSGKAGTLKALNEVDHKIATGSDSVIGQVEQLEKLLSARPALPTTDAIKLRVTERALAGRAPYHREKNSVGDAILIETFADAVARKKGRTARFAFVTHNYKDFSEPNGDRRLPHPDIAGLFAPEGSTYWISLLDALKVEAPELVDEMDFEFNHFDQPRRLSEILEAEHLLFRQVWYNRHWNLCIAVESGKTRVVSRENYSTRPYRDDQILDAVWQGALAAAKRTEDKVGKENLGPWTDFEWGMINGKLSALRWVLGDEWDMLDT